MHHLLKLAGFAAAVALASPASAALVVCDEQNCGSTDENLLFNDDEQIGTTVIGTTNKGTDVTVQGTISLLASGGQASVTAADGGPLTGGITFFLTEGGTFTAFEFNLQRVTPNSPVPDAASVTFNILGANGVAYTSTLPYPTYPHDGNGSNWFSGFTNGGDVIKSVSFTINPAESGVRGLTDVRLGGVAPIPEPATWALMLLGFGTVGYSLRRRGQGRLKQAV